MPYVLNEGIRIHYEMTEGEGSPLVLHPGFAGCAEDWRDFGLAEGLARHHRLIFAETRGHGASDKPHDPAAYEPTSLASDIIAILNDLGLRRACYYGHSYGGWIGWALGAFARDRFDALVISGSHPFQANQQGMRDLITEGVKPFLDRLSGMYGPFMNEVRRARLAANDFASLSAAARDRASYEAVLSSITLPCLLVGGDADGIYPRIQEALPRLPDARLHTMPGCDHVATFGRPDLVVPAVVSFLAEVASRQQV